MPPLLRLIRPQQWVKNLFVFLPIFFGGQIFDGNAWLHAMQAFVALCLAASGIYCLNDIIDMPQDRMHPHKRLRPLAAGTLSIRQAYTIMALCLALGLLTTLLFGCNILLTATVAAYILLHISYCLWLKQVPIVDLVCVALGFVLRVVAGGISTGIWISEWIVMMTFMLTLFLATSKRRFDIIVSQNTNLVTRKNIDGYSIDFLNIAVGILASVTIVCYIMYTVSPEVKLRSGSDHLYLTSIFVITSILHYIQKTMLHTDEGSDPTYMFLHDRFIQFNLLAWIACYAIILYV